MEANEKKTVAEWPADAMASLILPNGFRQIYRKLRDPKEQDAVSAWLCRYIVTGEDRANYNAQEYLKILLKDEVLHTFKKQRAFAANGAKGGRPRKANGNPTESQTKANEKPTESQAEANGKPTESQAKANGKPSESQQKANENLGFQLAFSKEKETKREKENQKKREEEIEKSTHTPSTCASARAGEDGAPAPAETPEAEAKRLGFGQYAPVAEELRELMGGRAETMAATVYMAADGKGMSAEELLGWARHRQRQGWRTGQGGGVLITRANVASDIAIWAANQANFRRAGSADGARPAAAQQEGGAAEGKKPAKRKWKFDRERMEEDRYGYIWAVPDEALGQFAAWYCGEEGNERAVGFYERVVRDKGAHAFRRELEKFVGAVASGEEPENRGAAFTAALKEI